MVRCKAYLDIMLNGLGVQHEFDGRTDSLVANAALNYTARPITSSNKRSAAYVALLGHV